MVVVALDTHALVKDLQAAGFNEAQAEAVTRAVGRTQNIDLTPLAKAADLQVVQTDVAQLKTDVAQLKTDVAQLKTDVAQLRTDFDGLRKDTRADIAELKADLLKWMFGAIGFQTIVLLGALVAIVRLLRN